MSMELRLGGEGVMQGGEVMGWLVRWWRQSESAWDRGEGWEIFISSVTGLTDALEVFRDVMEEHKKEQAKKKSVHIRCPRTFQRWPHKVSSLHCLLC